MNGMIRIIGILILLGTTIGSGIWLHNLGKPLNSLVFTLHKLIALGVVIFGGINIVQRMKGMELSVGWIILFFLAILSVLILFVTGALLSMDKPYHQTLLLIHKLVTGTLLISGGIIIYFVLK